MSKDFKIPKEVAERLIDFFKLDIEQRNQIIQEFNKFPLQTSIRKFIKEASKRTELSERLLQNFFWNSFDMYELFLENSEPFIEFFKNVIKSTIENEYPDLNKEIYNFNDFENFLSRLVNLIDFEHYKLNS